MRVIIHNDNIDTSFFDKKIKYESTENIDKALNEIIKNLEKFQDIEAIYIKDNLSNNYLDFLGIRLTYHIRFSPKLKTVPIIIISELDSLVLNKLTYLAKIFFTKNTFLIKSSEIEEFKIPKVEFDYEEFLDNIEVKPPKDYLSHHSITNEWAIDRWASLLKIENETIRKNREKIENMLYYKYLKAKFENKKIHLPESPNTLKGKILLIDDKKEWGEIIEAYLNKFFPYVEFNFLGGFKRDVKIAEIEEKLRKKINEFNPDTIILDLRLINKESNKIKEISGYKIMKFIKKINPAIQIILFTASKDSLILNAFFNDIVGYIQKDSPFEKYEGKNSLENFNLVIERALKKRYLKKFFLITNTIKLLYFDDYHFAKKVKADANLVFEILNSNIRDSFVYAVYQIIKILETITNKLIYFDTSGQIYRFKFDNTIAYKGKNSLRLKIYSIMKKTNIYDDEKKELICEIIEFRNRKIHGGKIKNSHCKDFIEKISQTNLIAFYESTFLILKKIKL